MATKVSAVSSISQILEESQKKTIRESSALVNKKNVFLEDADLDLGRLLIVDNAATNLAPTEGQAAVDINEIIKARTRAAVQEIANNIANLSPHRIGATYFVNLPSPQLEMPRSRPIPTVKPMTTWEKFAQAKGIKKKDKSTMKYDENTDSYLPTYGYKRGFDDTQDTFVELSADAEVSLADGIDPFQERKAAKKERVAKNEARRIKNTITNKQSLLKSQIFDTRKSTASLGKFDKKISNEPKIKAPSLGKKRHFDPSVESKSSSGAEKEHMSKLLDRVLNKGTKLDVTKVVAHNSARKPLSKPVKSKKTPKMGHAEKMEKREKKNGLRASKSVQRSRTDEH